MFREGREHIEDDERVGRPVTETTSENIEQVRDIINIDPHITVDELQAQTDLSHGTIQRIISDHLNLRKITARYVPKQLTDSQRAKRVQICKENLAKFESGACRLCDVVTGDESWFKHKQIGRKASNAAWVARRDPPPTVVRESRFSPSRHWTSTSTVSTSIMYRYLATGLCTLLKYSKISTFSVLLLEKEMCEVGLNAFFHMFIIS